MVMSFKAELEKRRRTLHRIERQIGSATVSEAFALDVRLENERKKYRELSRQFGRERTAQSILDLERENLRIEALVEAKLSGLKAQTGRRKIRWSRPC